MLQANFETCPHLQPVRDSSNPTLSVSPVRLPNEDNEVDMWSTILRCLAGEPRRRQIKNGVCACVCPHHPTETRRIFNAQKESKYEQD